MRGDEPGAAFGRATGKAVGAFKTFPLAPRVIIAKSNLVSAWATWEEFDRLEQATGRDWQALAASGTVGTPPLRQPFPEARA